MKALWFENDLSVRDLPQPAAENEALIRVTLAGICNTDIEITRGYMGFVGVPGHEFVGIVEQAPDSSWVGKRVVGEINCGCGACALCKAGDPRHCANRTVLGIQNRNGAFAEYLTLPLENLHEIPESIPDTEAVFIEPLAAACRIADQLSLHNQDVLVIGDGKLGQLVARVMPWYGARCTVIGKHEWKLNLVPERCHRVLLPDYQPKREYDIVVEASGHPDGFNLALDSLKPQGALVLKSTYAGEMTHNPARIVIDEIKIVGSRCGRFFKPLHLLADNKLGLSDLISATYPIQDGVAAFERALAPDSMKVLLEMP